MGWINCGLIQDSKGALWKTHLRDYLDGVLVGIKLWILIIWGVDFRVPGFSFWENFPHLKGCQPPGMSTLWDVNPKRSIYFTDNFPFFIRIWMSKYILNCGHSLLRALNFI